MQVKALFRTVRSPEYSLGSTAKPTFKLRDSKCPKYFRQQHCLANDLSWPEFLDILVQNCHLLTPPRTFLQIRLHRRCTPRVDKANRSRGTSATSSHSSAWAQSCPLMIDPQPIVLPVIYINLSDLIIWERSLKFWRHQSAATLALVYCPLRSKLSNPGTSHTSIEHTATGRTLVDMIPWSGMRWRCWRHWKTNEISYPWRPPFPG